MVGIHKDGVDGDVPCELLPPMEFTEDQYRTVEDAIDDLEPIPPHADVQAAPVPLPSIYPHSALTDSLRDTKMLHNHVATSTRSTALRRFAALTPGQNFHDLDQRLICDTYSLPSERRTQSICVLIIPSRRERF